MKKYIICMYLLILCGLCVTGCNSSGAQKPLSLMAKAMETQDSKLFLAQIDLDLFALAQIQNLTKENVPLAALDNLGKLFGVGGLTDLVGNIVDVKTATADYFNRGVSTGELLLECSTSQEPYCPWVPSALKNAKVKELSSTAAVAKVTTPAGMTSWIVLAKVGSVWKVSGQGLLENDAVELALKATSKRETTPEKSKQQDAKKSSDPYAPAPPPPASEQKSAPPVMKL